MKRTPWFIAAVCLLLALAAPAPAQTTSPVPAVQYPGQPPLQAQGTYPGQPPPSGQVPVPSGPRPPSYNPTVQSPGYPPVQSQPAVPGQAPPPTSGQVSPPASGRASPPIGQTLPSQPGQAPITATPLEPQTSPEAAQEQPPPPNPWLPQETVTLQALDKINAQSKMLTIKVGGSAQFGSLTIQVKACVIRPPDQPADAAAFLIVTDSHAETPGFSGWMLRSDPSLSMLQHPLYDLRVLGCGP
ncbi:MAG TPA: DUF2155 domain-containing protein [Acetobacteraceae bacterium]|nr:DUF2155 domain-containing protein [Acetobacteraceae bacterium]